MQTIYERQEKTIISLKDEINSLQSELNRQRGFLQGVMDCCDDLALKLNQIEGEHPVARYQKLAHQIRMELGIDT